VPLTADQYRTLIVTEVGDSAAGIVNSQISIIWSLYDAEPGLYRQYLHAKRKAIDLLMGTVREQVTIGGSGKTTDLNAKLRNLQIMRDDVTAEIGDERATRADARAPVSGQLMTTAPIAQPGTSRVDANATRFRGDPYDRSWRR
jgi:hypothetical protein